MCKNIQIYPLATSVLTMANFSADSALIFYNPSSRTKLLARGKSDIMVVRQERKGGRLGTEVLTWTRTIIVRSNQLSNPSTLPPCQLQAKNMFENKTKCRIYNLLLKALTTRISYLRKKCMDMICLCSCHDLSVSDLSVFGVKRETPRLFLCT